MKKLVRCLLLGVLIGDFLLPSTVHAQWTVFDPAQYSLQIERQIEEANRWLERVKQYSEQINKLAQQLSTMKGILGRGRKARAAQCESNTHNGPARANGARCVRA